MEQTNIKLKPSEEMVWRKYYPESAKNFTFPKAKIFEAVYEENRNRKDAIALECSGTTVSYGEFFDKVAEKTEFFQSKKVQENDVVMTSMLTDLDFVYDFYALGNLNAINDVIDPRNSVSGIAKYLEENEAKHVLNHNLFTGKIKKAIGDKDINVINYSLKDTATKLPFDLAVASNLMGVVSDIKTRNDSRFEKYSSDFERANSIVPEYKPNQPLIIVRTGGSTGFPKGVVLSHDNYNAMAYEYIKAPIGFKPNDRFLLVIPPWINYGSGMLHLTLVRGMTGVIISKLNSKKMGNYIYRHEPQWFAGVPAHFRIINDDKRISKYGLPFLKGAAVGGAATSAELFNASDATLVNNGASLGVFPGYSLTENTSACAVRQTKDFKPGSTGIPLPGGTVGIFEYDEIAEETKDNELDYNQRGEICIRGSNMMLGYYKAEELTDLVLKQHSDGYTWLHTGDIGYLDEDGFLFVDGRIKELITRHDAFKIYPAYIEKVISSHESIKDVKVVGIDDRIHNQGEIPKAHIVLKEGFEERQVLKELKERCKVCLPEYYTEFLEYKIRERIPLTPGGKPDFMALKKEEELEKSKVSIFRKIKKVG